MRVKSSDFKLGLFVVIGLCLLVIGMFIFGASKWFESTIKEETYATGDIGGLKVGSTVTLRGVHVGEVKKIKFSWNVYHKDDPRYVVIVFEIRPDASPVENPKDYAQYFDEQVKKGLRARIKSQGLAGATILSLEYVKPPDAYPPLEVPWKPHHIYIPSAPGEFNEILASVDTTLKRIKEIDFQKVIGLVEQDLAMGERLLTQVDKANLPAIGNNMNSLLTDLRSATSDLKSFIGNTNQQPQQVNLQDISKRTDELLARLQATVGKVEQMLGNVNESSLNATLENLQQASRNLQQTINQIQQYPSGAILGGPPPHAKSVERPRK